MRMHSHPHPSLSCAPFQKKQEPQNSEADTHIIEDRNPLASRYAKCPTVENDQTPRTSLRLYQNCQRAQKPTKKPNAPNQLAHQTALPEIVTNNVPAAGRPLPKHNIRVAQAQNSRFFEEFSAPQISLA